MSLKGVVLAGGRSSRYGTDKALAIWKGRTFLERSLELLDELGLDPEVIANPEKNYGFLRHRVHHDIVPGKGPLGGLCTAFSLFPGMDLMVLSCDMPLLDRGVLYPLVRRSRASGGSVIFASGGVRQPFPGVYARWLRELAEECLEKQRLGLKVFLSRVPDLHVLPPPFEGTLLSNVNTPEEHAQMMKREVSSEIGRPKSRRV